MGNLECGMGNAESGIVANHMKERGSRKVNQGCGMRVTGCKMREIRFIVRDSGFRFAS